MKTKTILLTGTYNSLNKGDAAMEYTAAKQLIDLGHEVIITSPFPGIDGEYYKPLSVSASSRRRLVIGSIKVVLAFIWRLLFTRLRCNWSFLLDEEARQFINADLIVDLSGDMLTEDYGLHVTYSHCLPMLMAIAVNKPFVLCAQSIGPFNLTRLLARYIINRAKFVSAREPITMEYLNALNLTNKNYMQYADLAFLLESSSYETIDQILRKFEKIDIGNKHLLGISVSPLIEHQFNKHHKYESKDQFSNCFSAMLDELIETLNIDIIFVPHVIGPGPSKDDRVIAQKISSKMKNKAHLIKGNYRSQELKGIISKCDLFVGARMHANIAALSSLIPTVAISYSHKTWGIMKLFDMQENVVAINEMDFSVLKAKVIQNFERRDVIKSHLKDKLDDVMEDAKQNISQIDEQLSASQQLLKFST